MKVYINSINVWLQGVDDTTKLALWANNNLSLPEEFVPPKPQYYPKGQLRRLSPYSKVVLHCLDIPQVLTQNLPLIFASIIILSFSTKSPSIDTSDKSIDVFSSAI